MDSNERVIEIDQLETSLLPDHRQDYDGAGHETVIFSASFDEEEENFVKYHTVRWLIYSLVLILAWGIGILMLIYLPVRRYVLRKDIQSRKLYVTPAAIVYKVTRPVPFPCFGVLKKEKHILLHSVSDVKIEQGYLQSLYGVYTIRIENIGVRRSRSDDFNIKGVANPQAFKKAVLTRLSSMRSEVLSKQNSTTGHLPSPKTSHVPAALASPSRAMRHNSFSYHGDSLVVQKLDEVGSLLKRVQTLIEEHWKNIKH